MEFDFTDDNIQLNVGTIVLGTKTTGNYQNLLTQFGHWLCNVYCQPEMTPDLTISNIKTTLLHIMPVKPESEVIT